MNRRNFLRAIIGTAAATALPSEVWPFRKIFLPTTPKLFPFVDSISGIVYPSAGRWLSIEQIEAIELEHFAKQIPYLLRESVLFTNFYRLTRNTHPQELKIDV
jgi:TAT (twin-arginine translocation) pathway signal sequence